jgi:hypothetical protein
MATGMLITWSGFTKEQYDRVMEALQLESRPQQGLLFHCSGQASGGWRVFDIWESQADCERFAKERLTPALEKAGVHGTPTPEFFPIHSSYMFNQSALNIRAKSTAGR